MPPNSCSRLQDKSAVQAFHKELAAKADIGGEKGKVLVEFDEFNFAVPRGRYEIKMYQSHFSLHGKTFNYKILYKSINKMFLLQAADYQHHIFIMGLDPPVRQGHTSYPYLIIQFKSDKHVDVNLNMDQDAIAEKYGGTLQKQMEGPMYQVVSLIFKALTKRKQIIVPGSFKSSTEQAAVRCSYRANEGYLYILEKSFFFIKKPAMYIRHDQVASIEFARLGGGNMARTFDLIIGLKNGESNTFTSIQRSEYSALFNFFNAKKLPIVNLKGQKNLVSSSGRFTGGASNYAEDDPYLNQIMEDDSDEGSEGDSDFRLQSDASGSSDDEGDFSEGDAEMAATDEDDDEEEETKSKKRKKPSTPQEKAEKKTKKTGPKRALSAYTFYSIENRSKFKEQFPEASFAELSKKLVWTHHTSRILCCNIYASFQLIYCHLMKRMHSAEASLMISVFRPLRERHGRTWKMKKRHLTRRWPKKTRQGMRKRWSRTSLGKARRSRQRKRFALTLSIVSAWTVHKQEFHIDGQAIP